MDGSDRQLVVVALPSEDDPVRKFSSEKEAHLTLLYLGDPGYDEHQIMHIEEYVAYASTLLPQFTLDVETRGELGDSSADVLFFAKWGCKNIATFREHLLQDPLISAAYHSTDQFPKWTPHLTMGYPETPAKKDTRDYPGFSYVRFDRIALWIGDSEGPTFPLKSYDYGMEVAMSQTTEHGRSVTGDILKHYGVKGMKWGVNRSESSSGSSGEDSASKLHLSADAKAMVNAHRKIESSGTGALSNHELQGLLTRMNLERQYHSMAAQHPTEMDRGIETVKKVLKVGKTVEDVRKFMQTPTGKIVKTGLKGAFVAASAYATGGGSAAAKVGAQVVIRRAANHYTNGPR